MKFKPAIFYTGILFLFALFYGLGRQQGKAYTIAVYQQAVPDSCIYFDNRTKESVDEIILTVPNNPNYPPLRIIKKLKYQKNHIENFELLLPFPDESELKEYDPPPSPHTKNRII